MPRTIQAAREPRRGACRLCPPRRAARVEARTHPKSGVPGDLARSGAEGGVRSMLGVGPPQPGDCDPGGARGGAELRVHCGHERNTGTGRGSTERAPGRGDRPSLGGPPPTGPPPSVSRWDRHAAPGAFAGAVRVSARGCGQVHVQAGPITMWHSMTTPTSRRFTNLPMRSTHRRATSTSAWSPRTATRTRRPRTRPHCPDPRSCRTSCSGRAS